MSSSESDIKGGKEDEIHFISVAFFFPYYGSRVLVGMFQRISTVFNESGHGPRVHTMGAGRIFRFTIQSSMECVQYEVGQPSRKIFQQLEA